jgi:hypothetical protein
MKARITHADIRCANGNINEVDTVLTPPLLALPALKAAPIVAPAPVASAPAETNAYTSIPAGTDTNDVPMVVPVIGDGAGTVTNAAPATR